VGGDDTPLRIIDDFVPLGEMPKTGLSNTIGYFSTLLLASALITSLIATIIRKLKREPEEAEE